MTKTADSTMEAIRPMRHDLPHLIGPLPGPRAQEVIARDHRSVSPSYTRGYPLVAKRGEGAIVEDVDGNRFLDFNAGIAVVATGHCHPRVVEAIREQAGTLIHMSGTDFYYEALVDLAEKLGALAPGGMERRVSFCNSGAEAVEGAIKLARYSTGPQTGSSRFWALSTAAPWARYRSPRARRYSAAASDRCCRAWCTRPIPTAIAARSARHAANCAVECAKFIEDTLLKTIAPAEEVAAIVVEPVQGEGGYIVPPQKFFDELAAHGAEKHGILLVCDEVQSGMGRTGKMWASEHFDLRSGHHDRGQGHRQRAAAGSHGGAGGPDALAAGRARLHLRRQPGGLRRGAGDHRTAGGRADRERRAHGRASA